MNRDRQLSLFVLACLVTGLMLGCGGGQNKKPPIDLEPKELVA